MHFSILLVFLAVSLIHQGQAAETDVKPYPIRNCDEEDRFVILCARPVKPEDKLKTAEGLMGKSLVYFISVNFDLSTDHYCLLQCVQWRRPP
jgi:hypothetical protein